MIKIFNILILILCFNIGYGQQYPNTQPLGSINSIVKVGGGLQIDSTLRIPRFADTSRANMVPYLKFYSGAIIYTTSDQNLWIRNSTATSWVQISGGGGGDTTIAKFPLYIITGGAKDSIAVYGVDSSFQNAAVRNDSLVLYRFSGDSTVIGVGELGYIPLSGTVSGSPVTGAVIWNDGNKDVLNINAGDGDVQAEILFTNNANDDILSQSVTRFQSTKSGVVKEFGLDNSNFFEIRAEDPLLFAGIKGGNNFSANYDSFTYVQKVYVDSKDSLYVPLAGTMSGFPITGDVQIDSQDGLGLYVNNTGNDNTSRLGFYYSGIGITTVNTLNSTGTSMYVSSSEMNITSSNSSSKGIVGGINFMPNLTNDDSLAYIQKIYADSLVVVAAGIHIDETIVATGGQTAFTFTSVPIDYADYFIFVNGAEIENITYFTTSGNIVTFTSPLVEGDRVRYRRIR